MQQKPYFERPVFGRPVQTAPALEKASGIHRTVYTYGAKRGLFGEAAYRSEDSWLFDTSHPDFDRWFQEHKKQKRTKGEIKKHETAQAET